MIERDERKEKAKNGSGKIFPTKPKISYCTKTKALYQIWATVLTNGKGIPLPRGCYDRFRNTGGRPRSYSDSEPIKIRLPSTEQESKASRSRLDRAKTILSSRSPSKEVFGRCKHLDRAGQQEV